MQWIIILLIILVLVALRGFVGRQRKHNRWNQNRGGTSRREAVVPRPPRFARDMEAGDELEPAHRVHPGPADEDHELERMALGVGSGAEDYVDLENTPHGLYGTALIPHYDQDEEVAGEMPVPEDLRRVISRQHRHDTDLHHRAEKYHRSAVITPLTIGKARSHRILSGLPEVDSRRLLVLEPGATPDHQIKIGVTPPPIPAHQMPVYQELSPSLIALAKDPYWVFVYWILPAEVPVGQWELRVQNLSEQSEFFERIDPAARRWYLQLNQPGNSFAFELGVRDAAGQFHSVLSCSPLQMPPDRPSNLIDAEWLTIEELYQGQGTLQPQGSAAFALEMGGASEMLQGKH